MFLNFNPAIFAFEQAGVDQQDFGNIAGEFGGLSEQSLGKEVERENCAANIRVDHPAVADAQERRSVFGVEPGDRAADFVIDFDVQVSDVIFFKRQGLHQIERGAAIRSANIQNDRGG